jgi:hypothetical protein
MKRIRSGVLGISCARDGGVASTAGSTLVQ